MDLVTMMNNEEVIVRSGFKMLSDDEELEENDESDNVEYSPYAVSQFSQRAASGRINIKYGH